MAPRLLSPLYALVALSWFACGMRPARLPVGTALLGRDDPLAQALRAARRGRLRPDATARLRKRLCARAAELNALGARRSAQAARAAARALPPRRSCAEVLPRDRATARAAGATHRANLVCHLGALGVPPAPARERVALRRALVAALGGQLLRAREHLRALPPFAEVLRWRARLAWMAGRRRQAARILTALLRRSPGCARHLPEAVTDLATLGLVSPARRAGRALLASGALEGALLRPAVLALLEAGAPDGADLALTRWAASATRPAAVLRFGVEQAARRGDAVWTANWARRLLLHARTPRSPAVAAVWRALASVGRLSEARALRRWARAARSTAAGLRHARPGRVRAAEQAAARYARLLRRDARTGPAGAPPPAGAARGSTYRELVRQSPARPAPADIRRALADALLLDPCRFDRPALLLLAAGLGQRRRLSAPLRSAMLALKDARVWRP